MKYMYVNSVRCLKISFIRILVSLVWSPEDPAKISLSLCRLPEMSADLFSIKWTYLAEILQSWKTLNKIMRRISKRFLWCYFNPVKLYNLTCCCAIETLSRGSWGLCLFQKLKFYILIFGSKSMLFIRKSLRKTQENVDQSGESKAPLGWQVVRTNGVANQSWSKTFSKD